MKVKLNKRLVIALAGLGLGGSAGATSTHCTAVYASSATDVSAFNPRDGSMMFTPVTGQTNANALSLNPADGYLYWVNQQAQFNGTFYYFNVYRQKADGSGSPQLVGYINRGNSNVNLIAGGFDADGTYYVMGTARVVSKVANIASASGGGQLSTTGFTVTANSSTGTLYNPSNGDLAFDSSGRMWITTENASRQTLLLNVDPVSGNILGSPIPLRAPSGSALTATTATGVNGLTIDATDNTFYITSTITGAVGLLRVNMSNGNTTLINSTLLNSTTPTDLGSCPVIPDVPTISKTFTPSSVTLSAGGTATSALRITLGNSNLAPLYLYSPLTDTLPSGMTIPSGASVTTSCPNTNGNVGYTATSVTLPAGTSVPVGGCTIDVSQVSVSSAGTYTNSIGSGSLVTSTGTVGTAANATFTVASPPTPQFSITKTDNGATFYRGSTATYTVTVTNTVAGSASSGAINIRDVLPAGLTFNSVTVSGGVGGTISNASAAGSGGTVGWNFTPSAPMTGNQSVTFTLTVNVGASTPTGTNSITNYASVGGGGGSAAPTPSSTCTTQCGTDSTTVSVPSSSDLSITKTDGTGTITANGNTTYTIRVTNSGPAVVTGAVLRDAPPSGMTFGPVACSTAFGNICTTALTPAQVSSGFALPTLASGAFYEITVAASTTLTSGSVANTATVTAPTGITETNTANNTVTDTNSVVAVSTAQPPANSTPSPAVCDVTDGGTSGITGWGVGQTGAKIFNSKGGLSLTTVLSPATGSGNGIQGWNAGFSTYGSWYEVRAVSTSLTRTNTASSYGGAFVTRGGGGTNSSVNTITITFPHPVINVRFGITDLDAVGGGDVNKGDWLRATATYNGTTFNPDTLIAGGHALEVRAYTTTGTNSPGTAAAGADMTVSVPGRGNSTMGGGSVSPVYNTLMGTDIAYGAQVTDLENGGTVNRQGQGVAYFKGPLTTLTIVTGSQKGGTANAIAFGNIDFCSPSMAVSKVVGTPTLQNSDGSYNIPYTLTYRNTSYNQGLFPDATVRDTPFQPSIVTPSGLDPWADLKPQLSDTVIPQILANTNIQSAAVIGSPKITFDNATGTRNLDAGDANPSFDGTAANPTLMTSGTDARVSAGSSFDTKFTVNAVIKSSVTAQQTVNNQATASGSLNTASATLSATSTTVAATLTPVVRLTLRKTVDQEYVRYLGDPAKPNFAELNYTITVNNPNTVTAASGVVVTDTLPDQVTHISSSPAASVSGQTLTWNLGTVAAGGSATITVKVKVPLASTVEASQPQATWTNTASVSGTNTTSATASAATDTVYTKLFKQVHNLGPNPPAAIPQQSPAWSSSGQGLPGEVLEYCINFHNYGSTALANYVISDKVPSNTTIVDQSWVLRSGLMDSPDRTPYTGGSVTYTAPIVRGTIASLAPGSQGSMCFRAQIN